MTHIEEVFFLFLAQYHMYVRSQTSSYNNNKRAGLAIIKSVLIILTLLKASSYLNSTLKYSVLDKSFSLMSSPCPVYHRTDVKLFLNQSQKFSR